MELPKTITTITGEYQSAYEQIDKFFDSIINRLEPKPLKPPSYFEKRTNQLCYFFRDASYNYCPHHNNPPPENIFMLLYKESVVALVTETRTGFNYIRFNFFKNLKNIEDFNSPNLENIIK